MKIERTKNAMRNIMFDGFFRVLNMVLPFIMRSVILYYLGAEYLGLNGLFRSILSFLNLAELGVGSAMVFSITPRLPATAAAARLRPVSWQPSI